MYLRTGTTQLKVSCLNIFVSNYSLSWKILDIAPTFSHISKTCKLSTLERYYLICKPDSHTLNINMKFAGECLRKRFMKWSTVKWDIIPKSFHPWCSLSEDQLKVKLWLFVFWPVVICTLKIVFSKLLLRRLIQPRPTLTLVSQPTRLRNATVTI